jgi:pyruvate dehydrogenase E1 component alpha subunit
MLDDARDAELKQRAAQRVTDAYDFARESPLPDPAEALEHVFV